MQVKTIDAKTTVIQVSQLKTTVKQVSANDVIVTCENKTGIVLTYEIRNDGKSKDLIINNKTILSIAAGHDLPSNETLATLKAAYLKAIQSIKNNSVSSTEKSPFSSEAVNNDFMAAAMEPDPDDYLWDGVQFISQGYHQSGLIFYDHPDRLAPEPDVYPWDDLMAVGTNLVHFQMNSGLSQAIGEGGPVTICGAIGTYLGAKISETWEGAVAGGIIGAVLGYFAYSVTGQQILDEEGCIWYWLSQQFLQSIYQYYWYLVLMPTNEAMIAVSYLFVQCGYLRIGDYTYGDFIGAGNPSAPPDPTPTPTPTNNPTPTPTPTPDRYYVSTIASTQSYGSGSVNNPNYLTGSGNYGTYVQLWGGNLGDGGQIVGNMNDVAHGHVYVYGHSGDGYYTHLYVWVSYNNNNDWGNPISVQTVSGTNDRYIDCGTAPGNFRYIAIVAIDDQGCSANIFLDSVKVEP